MSTFIAASVPTGEEEGDVLCGSFFTECGAMCFVPTTEHDHRKMMEEEVALDSVFLHLSRTVYIYHNDDDWCVLLHCCDPTVGALPVEIQQVINERRLSYVGQVKLNAEGCGILRITDAREAHLVPKSPTPAQMKYAANKVHFPVELLQQEGHSVHSWQLSEKLSSMEERFHVEFWTGLNPQPLLDACIAQGLVGWQQTPEGHWALPSVFKQEDVEAQYRKFYDIKKSLNFRCGFDMKANHFVYDICQKKLLYDAGCEYPTDQGIAVGVTADNNNYIVVRVGKENETDYNKVYYLVELDNDEEDE